MIVTISGEIAGWAVSLCLYIGMEWGQGNNGNIYYMDLRSHTCLLPRI